MSDMRDMVDKLVDQLEKVMEHLNNVVNQVAELNCPKADGWEGAETFPDCGKCIVCESRAIIKDRGNLIKEKLDDE